VNCEKGLKIGINSFQIHQAVKKNMALEIGSDNKADKSYTLVQCKKLATVINCDYSEEVGPVEKILILISFLEIFPNSCFDLVSN
jgi:nitrogenase subunit NifH